MSRRINAQLRSLKRSFESENKNGAKITLHVFQATRIPNLFPEVGKRTRAKMQRLETTIGKR